jgi:hypothetical protein
MDRVLHGPRVRGMLAAGEPVELPRSFFQTVFEASKGQLHETAHETGKLPPIISACLCLPLGPDHELGVPVRI